MAPRPVVAIIQARMGSTRLPGKVLADVAGKPLLAHMLERVSLARSLDAVWVATSDAAADDAIARLAKGAGVSVFRGSESDVLGRYAGAAEAAGARTVVRLTADCPLLAPEVIDRVVARSPSAARTSRPTLPPQGAPIRTVWTPKSSRAPRSTPRGDRRATRRPRARHAPTCDRGGFAAREVHPERQLGSVRIAVAAPPQGPRGRRARPPELVPTRPHFGLEDVLAWLANAAGS